LLLDPIVSSYCFGTLDEDARVDPQSPANQAEYHDRADAKPAAPSSKAA
jgi:hypothetical protein